METVKNIVTDCYQEAMENQLNQRDSYIFLCMCYVWTTASSHWPNMCLITSPANQVHGGLCLGACVGAYIRPPDIGSRPLYAYPLAVVILILLTFKHLFGHNSAHWQPLESISVHNFPTSLQELVKPTTTSQTNLLFFIGWECLCFCLKA